MTSSGGLSLPPQEVPLWVIEKPRFSVHSSLKRDKQCSFSLMAKAFSSLCTPLNIRPILTLHRCDASCMAANSVPYTLGGRLLAVARHSFLSYRKQKVSVEVKALSKGFSDVEIPKSSDDSQILTDNYKNNEIKMQATVSGTRTQEIFDDVFSQMVNAAQPIPGFRRVKGGKTPDIPKEVLLDFLGPEKVKKEVIKKIIHVIVSEYVTKEGLRVSENLGVVESYEELEASFQPGKKFIFNAILQLQENGPRK